MLLKYLREKKNLNTKSKYLKFFAVKKKFQACNVIWNSKKNLPRIRTVRGHRTDDTQKPIRFVALWLAIIWYYRIFINYSGLWHKCLILTIFRKILQLSSFRLIKFAHPVVVLLSGTLLF